MKIEFDTRHSMHIYPQTEIEVMALKYWSKLHLENSEDMSDIRKGLIIHTAIRNGDEE